jgi:hypothetical protein
MGRTAVGVGVRARGFTSASGLRRNKRTHTRTSQSSRSQTRRSRQDTTGQSRAPTAQGRTLNRPPWPLRGAAADQSQSKKRQQKTVHMVDAQEVRSTSKKLGFKRTVLRGRRLG